MLPVIATSKGIFKEEEGNVGSEKNLFAFKLLSSTTPADGSTRPDGDKWLTTISCS